MENIKKEFQEKTETNLKIDFSVEDEIERNKTTPRHCLGVVLFPFIFLHISYHGHARHA
jgi:hypothetical protein